MPLAPRLALVTAVLSFGAALTACKKDEKKKEEPRVGSPVAIPDAGAARPVDKAAPAANAALSGFKGAMAKAGGDVGLGGMGGLGGGATGGLGGALGGIFGGGGGAGAEVAGSADSDDEPAGKEPEVVLPPGKAGGDCAAVADRLMVVVKAYAEAELGSLSPDERKMADELMIPELAKVRDQLVTMCTDEKWPQALIDCALTAPDMAGLQTCDKFAPAGIGGSGDDDEPAPEPVAQAPAWGGGDDCGSVGKRLMALAMHGMGEIPAEVRAELESELAKSAEEVAKMCSDGGWTPEIRQCVVKATTMPDAETCLANLASP